MIRYKKCPVIQISFRRTVRVSTGKESSMLPGDLGHFPIYESCILKEGQKKLLTAADFIFPMYGKEQLLVEA